MATKAALSEAKYLRTSFPGVDQEFRDGDVVERGVPDLFHSNVQGAVYTWFQIRRKAHPLYANVELRLRVRAGCVLIPDVCVFWRSLPTQPVPELRPLIVVEVRSADDRMSDVLEKLKEYKNWGVVHIWFVDPRRKLFYEFDEVLRKVPVFRIPEVSLEVTPEEIFEE